MTPAQIRFEVLGPLRVTRDGQALPLRPLQQRLVAILLLRFGTAVTRESVMAGLWEFARPPHARGTLHVEVRNLRGRLEPGTPARDCRVLRTTADGYSLAADESTLDLARFVRLHDEGRAALMAGDDRTALERLSAADELWSGPLLDQLSARFVRAARERYEPLRLSTKEGRCLAMLGLGQHDEARRYLWEQLVANAGSEPLRTLMEEVLTRSGRAARGLAAAGGPAPRHNLPRFEGPLVGRHRAAAELTARLRRSRLVTLVGLVGIGKSRLAISVAETLAGDFGDGIRYADLSGTGDIQAAAQAVLSSLGGREAPGQRLEDSLASLIADGEMLLVLDSCERAVPAAAELAGGLMSRCPRLHVLAVGAQRLGVPGEDVYRLAALATPADVDAVSVQDVRQSEAVELFAERASRHPGGFRVDETTAAAVAAICRRLDGIPLALELAASQLGALSVHQLAQRLDQRFFEVGQQRGGAAHQRTLGAAFDASHELLTGPQAVLFRRLAVFDGPVSPGCCEAACGYEPIARDQVGALLAGLVDKSLVVADLSSPAGPRYHMLRMVQLYAGHRLARAGEADELMARCAAWSTTLAVETRRRMNQPDGRSWLRRIDADYPAIRAALGWALRRRPEDALRLAWALGHYWDLAGMMSEGRRWLIDALASGHGSLEQRALALHEAAWLTWRQGDHVEADAMLANVVELWTTSDQPVPDEVCTIRGLVAISRGDLAAAEEHLLPVTANPATEPRVLGAATYNLGLARLFGGDVGGAIGLFEESLRHRLRAGYDPIGQAFSRGVLACIRIHDDRALAYEHLRAAFRAFSDAGDRVNVIYALEGTAYLHAVQGHDELAVQIASGCASLRLRVGASGIRPWDAFWRTELSAAERRLGDRAHAVAQASRSLGLDALCAYALESLDDGA